MVYRGHKKNRVVILDKPTDLPRGTPVHIESVQEQKRKDSPESLHARLNPIIGSVRELPEDFADNHDHHSHGVPKRP